jgi:preprotein translocase subunit YajC
MVDIAWAQTAPGVGGPGQLLNFLPLVLVFVVFYFLLIRPQQKKTKDHQQMLSRLKRNDEVMTSGGIYGKVVALTEEVVTLEIAPNVRVRVHRPQISAVLTAEKGSSKEAKE